MTEYGLHKQHEWIGEFWPAGEEDRVVAGILRYAPDHGVSLHLLGRWPSPHEKEVRPGHIRVYEGNDQWGVVHGHSGRTAFTLLDVSLRSSRYGTVATETTLSANTLLVGCHLNSREDAAFNGVSATVENLTAWAARTAITVQRDPTRAETQDLSDLVAAHPGGSLRLRHRINGAFRSETRDRATVDFREWVSARFELDDLTTLEGLLAHVSMLTDLVSFATCTPAGVMYLTAQVPEPDDDARSRPPQGISILHRRIVHADADAPLPHYGQFLFTLGDTTFAELWPRWAATHKRFHQPIAMLLGLREITEGFIETRVITAVSAAESMHTRMDFAPQMPDQIYRALRTAVKSALADPQLKPQKQWTLERLTGNVPTLRHRLRELADRPGDLVGRLIPAPDLWAAGAVKARNGLAHDGAAVGVSDDLLFAAVEVTAAVVVLNLLFEVGLADRLNAERLFNHPTLRLAKRLANEHFSGSPE